MKKFLVKDLFWHFDIRKLYEDVYVALCCIYSDIRCKIKMQNNQIKIQNTTNICTAFDIPESETRDVELE